MEQAFRLARAADPRAKLLYNDYNMHNPRKRAFLLDVLRGYRERGVPIDGIGLQGHVGLTTPDLVEWEASIAAYEALGLEVHVTELEVDVMRTQQNGAEINNARHYAGAIPIATGWTRSARLAIADEQRFRSADHPGGARDILGIARRDLVEAQFYGPGRTPSMMFDASAAEARLRVADRAR